ncbi:thromboxane A2 receptor isoform X4 [Cyclopterus lumpus]|uniref:thromboxane A2 receptor isoform X4 n=1 Tax=Cyclopterus lumpus TaxID=8103 RepID=UPI001486BC9A|nr:thromboxane A2 receptor isoform X4 [Cyclopterus lumpus]
MVEERNEILQTGIVFPSLSHLKSMTPHQLNTMNASVLPFTNNTPICYSINSPPFKYHPTIASAYYSSIFTTLGIISNLIAFVVLLKSFRRTHNRSRSFLIFLGGLVITDSMGLLITGSIVISFHVTYFNWRQLDPNCHFCNFMGMSMVFYGLCPLLLGAAMAMERYIGINRPFARSASMPKRRTISMDRNQRRRDHEVEMMVQLILIMVIASICWCPLLVFIAQTVLSGGPLRIKYLLLWLRFATWNQILDPWVYILFRRAILKRIYPRFDWSRGSIVTMYPSFRDTVRRFTRSSLGSTLGSDKTGEAQESNVTPKSTLKPPPPSP